MVEVKKIGSPEDLERLREEILARRDLMRPAVSVCTSTGCISLGARDIVEALERELEDQGLRDKVDIRETGCLGFCEQGPRVTIYPEETCYFRVKPEDISEIVSETILGKRVVERLIYEDLTTGRRTERFEQIPFYKSQLRLLLGNNSRIDPEDIDDYIALGGYRALSKALFEMTPEEVLEEVKRSNLRGRGGGGFPTGLKWETTRDAQGEPKYVVVNCDEGDPGAFMDRSLMEGNPHSILEGFIIGAYAIGAHEGYVYVREEYPIAVEKLSTAITQAEELGLLKDDIMGSGFGLSVRVHRGAGAFVSGESSSLMMVIEGKVGEPRPKYVHTAIKGIRDKPTCLNNVETWANIPQIILRGAEWFRSIGTEGSSGTKIFSLVGKVENTGLVEVPMGVTLRDLIYEIGGGIRGKKRFKAIQIGGPSGGFIPEEHLDLPVDFDELTKAGSMIGSGGMVVMDEDTCMVDTARYFVDFLLEESCGKCIPCREGLKVLSGILKDICKGRGREEDIETVKEIAETMRDASLCALGRTAANPVLTSLRYFVEEWSQHIKEKRCQAKACRSLINYYIDADKCVGCLICKGECPVEAIQGENGEIQWIDQEKCVKCGMCYEVCNLEAVKRISGEPVPTHPDLEVVKRISGEPVPTHPEDGGA